MKTRKVKTIDGEVVTEYIPETQADYRKLEEMIRTGEMSPPGSVRPTQPPASAKAKPSPNSSTTPQGRARANSLKPS